MLLRKKKSQSILEYALLIGVIAAALLVMQVFVKRGFQGRLKDSADRLGDQFSASGTTTYQKRTLGTNQVIREGSTTSLTLSSTTTTRTGGKTTSESKTKTDGAKYEAFNSNGLPTVTLSDFSDPSGI